MIETIRNAWRIPELKRKLLFTLFVLVAFRFGASAVAVPFINVDLLKEVFNQFEGTILGYVNMMSGGAFANATIFAMSITPYINASIIMTLLTIAIPALEKMQKEGDEGRKKIASITRYLTVVLGLLQGLMYYIEMSRRGIITERGFFPGFVVVLSFTAGTALLMWLGEQINEKGIGNGISMILFAGIISRAPSTINATSELIKNGKLNYFSVGIILIAAILIVAFVVFMNNAERRIPVQYAKRVVGRKMYGGQSTHLPLKVNMSGVMPIIFASTFVTFPATIAAFLGANPKPGTFWAGFLKLFSPSSMFYAVVYFLLIIAFSYFYNSIQFNPIEVANNLKKNGGFVPGLRPGKPTSDFLLKVLGKLTLIGALFLGVIAAIPIVTGSVFGLAGLSLGGTSILIIVGVALETVKALEAQMLMRHYKGFLE